MTSEDRIILDYMAMLNHLSSDLKLRLIMQLTNSLRKEYVEGIPEKDEPWKGLFGAWRDTDENLAQFVREGRLLDWEIPSFD
ncbi:hypothetical protein [Haliscomenobacter sp.]|uniref:hypothetical protein n=1 Tax=Haliscomenobacter sp. TaxID=2717303 RepID=UPI0035946950